MKLVANGELREAWESSSLWRALSSMKIGPEGAVLSFEARLARENGWSLPYAAAVTGEYKRFLFLAAAAAPRQVTPSADVDEAWHLHLAYSRHYWEVLCDEILERPLHHGPTLGGSGERARYRQQYEETLALYTDLFGSEPPHHIWPPADVRFAAARQRVDLSRNWIIPKLRAVQAAAIVILAILAGACTAAAEGAGQYGSAIAGAVLGGLLFTALVLSNSSDAAPPPRRKSPRRREERGGDGGYASTDGGGKACDGGAAGGGDDCGGGGGGGGGGCGGGCGS